MINITSKKTAPPIMPRISISFIESVGLWEPELLLKEDVALTEEDVALTEEALGGVVVIVGVSDKLVIESECTIVEMLENSLFRATRHIEHGATYPEMYSVEPEAHDIVY
jgi:hypothetical protein